MEIKNATLGERREKGRGGEEAKRKIQQRMIRKGAVQQTWKVAGKEEKKQHG